MDEQVNVTQTNAAPGCILEAGFYVIDEGGNVIGKKLRSLAAAKTQIETLAHVSDASFAVLYVPDNFAWGE